MQKPSIMFVVCVQGFFKCIEDVIAFKARGGGETHTLLGNSLSSCTNKISCKLMKSSLVSVGWDANYNSTLESILRATHKSTTNPFCLDGLWDNTCNMIFPCALIQQVLRSTRKSHHTPLVVICYIEECTTHLPTPHNDYTWSYGQHYGVQSNPWIPKSLWRHAHACQFHTPLIPMQLSKRNWICQLAICLQQLYCMSQRD